MRRTRILCTIGPASDNDATVGELLDAGADAFRLNFSHGTQDAHAATYRRIRTAAAARGRHVAILQDLGGPKIRIGALSAPFEVEEGASLIIERGDFVGDRGRVSCTFDALFTSVGVGQALLIDDGKIELQVTGTEPGRLVTKVVEGGLLEAKKGINIPGTIVRTSALTPKDVDDLRAGVAMGVDIVAVSFVQSAEDIVRARAVATAAGASEIAIVAKIEKPQAVERIDEILEVADGLMVARGDLGIEVPLERLPAIQKQLVLAARRRGVPVIVATQVLESMRTEARPTRAEVTDAAHAVDERADAIMLSGETAVGRYPVRAAAMLDAIVREAERTVEPGVAVVPEGTGWSEHGRALCEAAVALAHRSRATAIVALTEAGKTARMLAALRPPARIVAATASASTAARLALVWGVTPLLAEQTTVASVREALLAQGLVTPGAVVVFVSMHAVLGREDTNFVHVERT